MFQVQEGSYDYENNDTDPSPKYAINVILQEQSILL